MRWRKRRPARPSWLRSRRSQPSKFRWTLLTVQLFSCEGRYRQRSPSITRGSRSIHTRTSYFVYSSCRYADTNRQEVAGATTQRLSPTAYNRRMPIDLSILNEVEHLRELNGDEKTALAAKIDLVKFAAKETIFS